MVWEWLSRAMDAVTERKWIGVEIVTGKTGFVNKSPEKLVEVQDHVWNDPALKARNGLTFCNMAWLKVCQGLGCHDFDPPAGGEPYMADQLWYYFQRKENVDKWIEKDIADVQALVNQGSLICAVSSSWILNEAHGHIVSLTPGDPVWSESMQKFVPVCMNVGAEAVSSRRIGINWAFPMKRITPKLYAWKELL